MIFDYVNVLFLKKYWKYRKVEKMAHFEIKVLGLLPNYAGYYRVVR